MAEWLMGGMLVIAIISLWPALFGRHSESAKPEANGLTEQLNLHAYQSRLQELKAEAEYSQLDPATLADLQQELKLALAYTLPPVPPSVPVVLSRRREWLLARLFVLIFIPLLSIGLYRHLGTDWRALKPVVEETAAATPAIDAAAIEAMVGRLAAKLAANPSEQPEGWLMLGKSYRVLQRYAEAAMAYAQADQYWAPAATDPVKKADLWADYAESLVLADAQQHFSPKSMALLNQALAIVPDHDKTHWLLGMAAFVQHQPDQARYHWQKLADKYPQDTLIQDYLAELKAMPAIPATPALPQQPDNSP